MVPGGREAARGVVTAATNGIRPARGPSIFDYVLVRAVIDLVVLPIF